MLIHQTQPFYTPQQDLPQAPAAGRARGGSGVGVASTLKYAITFGLAMFGGASARALSAAAQGSAGALEVPQEKARWLLQPGRHLAAMPDAVAASSGEESPSSTAPTLASSESVIVPIRGQAITPEQALRTDIYLQPLGSQKVLDGKARRWKPIRLSNQAPFNSADFQVSGVWPGQARTPQSGSLFERQKGKI